MQKFSCNSQGDTTLHRKVEPYAIEFYERHFYLVAYSHNSGQMHDFRVDRISGIDEVQRLPRDQVRERPTMPLMAQGDNLQSVPSPRRRPTSLSLRRRASYA